MAMFMQLAPGLRFPKVS